MYGKGRVFCSLVLLCLLVTICGCRSGGGKSPGGVALKYKSADRAPLAEPLNANLTPTGKFTRLSPDECGIDFYNDIQNPDLWLSNSETQAGLAAGDYDNDGDIDVFLVGIDSPNKLYRNDGGFKFTDVTSESGAGLDGTTEVGSAAVFADLDNDGDLDLYVCNKSSPDHLFINDGHGKFTQEGEARGFNSHYASVQAAVFDADLDGDLDLYVCNHKVTGVDPVTMASLQPKPGQEASVPPNLVKDYYVDPWNRVRLRPDPDEFYLNDGRGHFTEATGKAGLSNNSWSLQAQAADFTGDGWPDLYVASDFETPDLYYVNNGDGTFTNRAEDMLRKTPLFSMGCDSGDINQDGEPDLFAPDMLARDYKRAKRQSGDMWQWRWEFLYMHPQPQMRNMLQVNRGDGWFSDIAQLAGVDASDWTWSGRLADLNSDGIPEIFCTTGMARDVMDVDTTLAQQKMIQEGVPLHDVSRQMLNAPVYKVQNYLFSATEPLKYKLVDDSWGMTEETFSAAVSMADFDGDGDRDLIINNSRDNAMIWRNDLEQGNRVVIDLRQEGPNSQAVGARVKAYCGDQVFMDDVIVARGYATGEPCRVYLGLGQHDKIDKLEVRWPDRMVQTETDLAANMHYTVYRRSKVTAFEPEVKPALFAQAEIDYEQREADTQKDEFEREPLLPLQQTQLGTGAGVCDADGDGKLDIYLAGPAGQAGKLFKGNGDGTFAPDSAFSGALPVAAEEMAVLWFDANGDGTQDLLVTSGGEEAPAGSQSYQSKLFLNTNGKFGEKGVPSRVASTGAACATDFDGDGDLDLLLCGHIPDHHYAEPVPSSFWVNDGEGNFSDESGQVIPGLTGNRQITDAQFVDLSGDGKDELLISRYFGAVEVWHNTGGKFVFGEALTKPGMWRSLGVGDFDGDGDFDILAGNIGASTKYHPKDGAPVTFFANDFDGNGSRDLIEVKFRKDGCMLPGRGRSCSGYAIGYIPQKWPTWDSFANATLEDVYGLGLKTAQRYDAEEVHNVLLTNQGTEKFTESELPGTAQWAPVFGIALGDFNADGNLDAFLANNFTYPQPEAGRWSTGYGVVLQGDGKGGFKDLWPADSGLRIWQDARSAVAGDFNKDGLLDLAVSVSNGKPVIALANKGLDSGSGFWVQLTGRGRNSAGIGATVKATLASGKSLLRAVQAGSGYLGSYSGPLHFGVPAGDSVTAVEVTWPGGQKQSAQASGGEIQIKQD